MGLSLSGLAGFAKKIPGANTYAHFATSIAGGAAGLLGAPGTRANLAQASKNIANPHASVRGYQNPVIGVSSPKVLGLPTPASYYSANKQQPGVKGYTEPGDGGGATSPTYSNGSYGWYGGSGTGGASGGGQYYSGGQYGSPDQEAATRNNLRSDIQAKYKNLSDVLNGIYGDLDNVIKSRTGQLLDNYNTQENDLTNSYKTTTGQTQSVYAGRGLSDSSYLGDAQSQNADIFSKNLNQITQDKTSKLADLGQFNATTRAKYGALKGGYDSAVGQLGQYDTNALSSLQGQLQGSVGDANQARAGMQTDQQFISGLNAITPIQQQGTQQLAARLQNLVSSSAPPKAKQYVAQGLIKASTLGDPNTSNYWNSYFQQLLGSAGA